MMQLSIIVPIFNVEKYLRKCVDTLLLQDMQQDSYEIILVDDGSTDESGRIADEYAASHPNIRVLHQPNAGLSEARNTGIRDALGEYIMFVDSDDYIEPNVLGGLLSQCEREQLDVLRFDYQNVRYVGGEYQVFQPNKFPHPVDTCTDVVDGETYLNERMGYACYVCQFVMHHELTDMFMPGIYFEDTEWTPRMLLKAKRVTSVDTIVYNYLMRQGSITQTTDLNKKRKSIEDRIKIIKSLQRTSCQAKDRRWFEGMTASLVTGIISGVATYFYNERNEWLQQLAELSVYPISYYHLTKAAKRKARLINLSPRLFCWVLHLMRKGK